jgi:hypothetical protein
VFYTESCGVVIVTMVPVSIDSQDTDSGDWSVDLFQGEALGRV